MFCRKCGTQIAEDVSFCPKCGTKVVSMNDVQQSSGTAAAFVEPQQTGSAEPMVTKDTPSPDDAKAKKDAKLHKIATIGRVLMVGPIILMALASFGILPFPIILVVICFPLGTILSIIGTKRPWGLKKIIEFIVPVLVSLVLIIAFSSGGAGDKYVQMVKNGTLEAYPQMEVGEAFDGYLKNPKWESGLSEDNIRFVNVTGEILYYDKEVEIVIQFIVDEENESFQYNACEINDVPQSDFIFWALLKNIYEEY